MLKILQARLQQYVNHEFPDVQAEFRKGNQRNQRSNCQHPLDHGKRKRVLEKNIYFCFIDYAKAYDCLDHNKLWKILKELGIPDHLTCLLRKQQLELDVEQFPNRKRSTSKLYIVTLFI